MTFKAGDRVTVSNPIQPTSHKGGETGAVVRAETVTVSGSEVDLVQIQQDANGELITCYADELTKN